MRRSVGTLVGVMLVLGISLVAFSATITVPDDYPTIQAAIDAAQPGDTVYIKAGRYVENLLIEKPLSLVGEDQTKVRIEAEDTEAAVIEVRLKKGDLSINSIIVSGGMIGLQIDVAQDGVVEAQKIIAVENRSGVVAFGAGSVMIVECRVMNTWLVGIDLNTVETQLINTEIVQGDVGVLLRGRGNVRISNCLVGLCDYGVDAFAVDCGWLAGPKVFSGTITGKGNRIYANKRDTCPEHSDSLWPQGFVDLGWRDTVGKIITSYNEGRNAQRTQDYQTAIKAYSKCRALYASKSIAFPMLEVYWLENTGWIYGELGRYEDALTAFNSTRAVYVSHGMDVDVAKIDENIGIVYSHLGRYEDALDAYESARAVYVSHGMEVSVAVTNSNIAVAYANLGLYTAAVDASKSARAVFAKHGIELSVAAEDRVIGLVYKDLGNYEEALAAYQSARTVFAKHEMGLSVAGIDSDIGVVYYHLGRHEDALSSYQEALTILDKTAPAAGMKYSSPAARWMLYNNMGIAHEKLQDWNAARQSYEDSIAVIESLRSYMKAEEIKTAWQQQTQDVYERLIKLLINHGQGTDAFPYAERCRARTFLDLLAKGPVGTIENVREQGIKTGVVNPEAISNDVQTVIHSLPADTAALEYFVTDKVTYVWVIAHGEVSDPIPIKISRQDLINKVVAFRQELEITAEGMVLVPPQTLLAKARDLYQVLIKPLEDKLTGIEHLIIVPSGSLFYVPFAALLRCPGCEGHDLYGGKYLVERYSLSYSPSLATLKYALTHTAYPQATFLGLADPDSGDPNIPRLPGTRKEAKAVAKLFNPSWVYLDKDATEDVVQSQSATAREVLLSTHGSFNPHNPMFSYLVMSPTSANKDAKLFAYEVFSLLLHADMVVLSACETLLPSLEDMKGQIKGVRGAGDDTPVKLTEDQLKELTAGDEVVGLTRAFISAGASSVLSSLWSVPSKATTQLMVSFYKHIEDDHMDKAQALRAAQLEVMNTTGRTQPWYWAAFDLMGDWR